MSENNEKYKRLAERLSKLSKVSRFDSGEEKEGWTLSHSFIDLEESFKKFSEEYLPKINKQEISDKELYNVLLEIGEEFRHILYHIKDPRFYRYLLDDDKR